MPERAEFQSSYLMRYLIMAAICLGGGLWFAYDGFVAWPRDLPAAEAYDQLRDIQDAEERISRWEALADENGWPKSTPKKTAERLRGDIFGQYVWMTLCFAAGIPVLVYYFASRGTWIEATEDGLRTSWGQEMKFSDVTLLNKKKWAKKGIAKAYYRSNGVAKTFTFDDFKYEREPLGRMLRDLESVLARDQIVGGPTEAETDAALSEDKGGPQPSSEPKENQDAEN